LNIEKGNEMREKRTSKKLKQRRMQCWSCECH